MNGIIELTGKYIMENMRPERKKYEVEVEFRRGRMAEKEYFVAWFFPVNLHISPRLHSKPCVLLY